MKKAISTIVAVVFTGVVAASALAAGSGGVTGPAFYVDGALYRTVGTPTDLSGTGAPAHSFDTIYEFGGAQPNVATAAPGDRGYNGGRWHVQVLARNGLALVLEEGGVSAENLLDLARPGCRRPAYWSHVSPLNRQSYHPGSGTARPRRRPPRPRRAG